MSYYEEKIHNFLRDNSPRKFKGIEIMLNLGIPEQALYHHLKKLVKQGEIKYENHKYFTE